MDYKQLVLSSIAQKRIVIIIRNFQKSSKASSAVFIPFLVLETTIFQYHEYTYIIFSCHMGLLRYVATLQALSNIYTCLRVLYAVYYC